MECLTKQELLNTYSSSKSSGLDHVSLPFYVRYGIGGQLLDEVKKEIIVKHNISDSIELKIILYNLIKARDIQLEHPSFLISTKVSRNKNNYHFKTYSLSNIKRIISILEGLEYIYYKAGYRILNEGVAIKGYLSYFYSLPKMQALIDKCKIKIEGIPLGQGDLVSLRHKEVKKGRKDGKYYKHTTYTDLAIDCSSSEYLHILDTVTSWNNYISSHRFTISIPSSDIKILGSISNTGSYNLISARIKGSKNKYRFKVDKNISLRKLSSNPSKSKNIIISPWPIRLIDGGLKVDISPLCHNYHRPFLDDWLHGGRWYCDGVSIPRCIKPHLYIDGEETVEVDFEGIHSNIAWIKETGKAYIGDIYRRVEIPAWKDKDTLRAAVKISLLVLLNASSIYEAEESIICKIKCRAIKKDRCITPKNFIQKVINTYPEIKHLFGQKNLGIRLQSIDAQLMELISSEFISQKILGLLEHDGVRCKKSDSERVLKIMEDASKKILGISLKVKIK